MNDDQARRSRELLVYSSIALAVALYFFYRMPLFGYRDAYIAQLAAFVVTAIAFAWLLNARPIYLFEPIGMVTLYYMAVFAIRPMLDILHGEVLSFGVDVMGGAVRGSAVYVLSYLAFLFGYCHDRATTFPSRHVGETPHDPSEIRSTLFTSWIIWGVSYVVLLAYVLLQGKSLAYVFSFGLMGEVRDQFFENNYKFMTLFAYAMVIPWVTIVRHDEGIVRKIAATVLTINLYVIRGTRVYLLCLLLALYLSHCIDRRKTPKPKTLLFIGGGLLLLFSLLQFVRSDLRHGYGWGALQAYGVNAIGNVFDADLTIYKQFYGIVSRYPSEYAYTHGKQIFVCSFTQFIPRFLWPGKPDGVLFEVLRNAVNERAVLAGVAFPNIGEYYFEFGIGGCVAFQFALGVLFKKMTLLYAGPRATRSSTLLYAALYSILFLAISRCNTGTALLAALFTALPVKLTDWARSRHFGAWAETKGKRYEPHRRRADRFGRSPRRGQPLASVSRLDRISDT